MIEKAGPDNQPSELIKALNANTEIPRQEFRDVCDAPARLIQGWSTHNRNSRNQNVMKLWLVLWS